MPIDKITTAAIVEKAGVPIGSVYQYVPNKLSVLAELARRVMERVDLATANLTAEDFGVLPWDQAIDRAIDATMKGYAQQPGYASLLLSIRPTPEFRAITDESNDRMAAMLAFHPALRRVIPPDRIELATRVAIQAANALQDWALSVDDPDLAKSNHRRDENSAQGLSGGLHGRIEPVSQLKAQSNRTVTQCRAVVSTTHFSKSPIRW